MNPTKTRYRTTNWPEYNRSLQNRGSLTVWMSPDILWLDGVRSGAQGRPKVYTDAAIQAILTLKVLFKLALRQARGRRATGDSDGSGRWWSCRGRVRGALLR